MKIEAREPQVRVQNRPLLDQRWTPVEGTKLAYQKDSHDLILTGSSHGKKSFGIVREHAVDRKGQLWLQSDRYLAKLTPQGLDILAESRAFDGFRGLVVRPDGVWCGQGKSLRQWSPEGKEVQNFPLDYRAGHLKEIDGKLVVQGDMLGRRLTVFNADGPVAEGRDVVLDSVRKHPQGGLAWLERGNLARWQGGEVQRHSVSPRADGWMARQGGEHLVKASENGGSQLLRYGADGSLKSRFDFGKDTYLRDLLVDENSPKAVVRLQSYRGNGPTRQIVESLNLESKGDLAWFGSWNRQRIDSQVGQPNLHPMVDAQGTVLLTDGNQAFLPGSQKPLSSEQTQNFAVHLPRQALDFTMTPAAAPQLQEFVQPQQTRLPGMERQEFENGKVSARSFFHQPKVGELQMRSPGLHQQFVLAHAMPGPLGSVLAAVTDEGKLVMSLPKVGLREFDLGSTPLSLQAQPNGFTVQLQGGRTAEIGL
ncbi:MAG: hypothetical protein J0I12_05570 [Candidatus Eremiobacteraeota bacterium]|nr:hypothetical protein [Candidatus Eremiobacteraeota bacterium]